MKVNEIWQNYFFISYNTPNNVHTDALFHLTANLSILKMSYKHFKFNRKNGVHYYEKDKTVLSWLLVMAPPLKFSLWIPSPDPFL